MKIYSYSPIDGSFTGVTDADESPLEKGVFLLPANATFQPPPKAKKGQTVVWRGDKWEAVKLQEAQEKTQTKQEVTWDSVRKRRNALLFLCDWTQVQDSPLTVEKRKEWASYRASLRAIPDSFKSPSDVVWPDIPK